METQFQKSGLSKSLEVICRYWYPYVVLIIWTGFQQISYSHMLQQITEWQKLFSQTRNNIAEILQKELALITSLFWSLLLEKVTDNWKVLTLDLAKIDLIIFWNILGLSLWSVKRLPLQHLVALLPMLLQCF